MGLSLFTSTLLRTGQVARERRPERREGGAYKGIFIKDEKA